ncbi:MAG: glycosyltransferase [Actinobacteria bacterium]|nr:glycosyltransferase [Actinomycetota bacterium]
MEIHQIVISASPGEAVTAAALDLRDVLRRVGPSEIFARSVDESLAGEVLPLAGYAARRGAALGRNVLVYHASTGDPEVCSFLLGRPEKLVLVYHNLRGPLVLSVGPVLPHRRPDLLLSAYHVLVTYLVPDAYLALVGSCPQPGYRQVLESYRLQLNLHRAWLPGPVSAEALAAWYRSAAVFVTVSEHEGVEAPVLEAMAFDVPVVARAFAAIPETVGGGGLLLPPDADAPLLAEALAEVLGSDRTRRGLVEAGRGRHATVDPEAARAAFLAHLAEAV